MIQPALFTLRNDIADSMAGDFVCQVDDSADELLVTITDTIGGDGPGEITADQLRGLLNDSPDRPIDVRINSAGGYVYEGVAISNMFRQHRGRVTATVESLAFSAATIVLLGADHTRIFENATYGIHRSSGVAIGNARTMVGVAEWLELIDDQLISGYAAKTGRSREWVTEAIDGVDDGSVWSGAEAVDIGFIDELIETQPKPRTSRESTAAKTLNRLALNKAKLAAMRIRHHGH